MATERRKRGDTANAYQRTLEYAVGGNFAPIDLTGATVKFLMKPIGSGTVLKVNTAATIVTAAAGVVKHTWISTDVDTVGVFNIEWEITFGDGTVETIPGDVYEQVEIIADLG